MSFSIKQSHKFLKKQQVKEPEEKSKYYFDPENPLSGLNKNTRRKKKMVRKVVPEQKALKGGNTGISMSMSYEAQADVM